MNRRRAFTLIELLVVIAVVATLAALLVPALSRARLKGQRAACLSNLSQVTRAFILHLDDHEDRFPDRRDLKASLPGGYRPWTSWPLSDPRTGWAAITFADYGADWRMWSCPGSDMTPAGNAVQSVQAISDATNAPVTRYWAWRFDRTNDISDPVMLTDFWNKTPAQAVRDLQTAADPVIGIVGGPSDVELVVDPYFPKPIPSVVPELSGRTVHAGGRSRGYLDGHAQFIKDVRTPW